MRYRQLGGTGLRVSEIGYGAWGISRKMWVGASDEESLRALRRAVDLGVNLIDTAYAYGWYGHSERLVGRFVRSLPKRMRSELVVATKIPPQNFIWPASPRSRARDIFPRDWMVRATETSLRRMGLECVDVQQLHVFTPAWAREEEWQDAFAELRARGKIRFSGVSLTEHRPDDGLELVRRNLVDVIQVIHNVFDQGPERRLFPLARKHGVGILTRVPLDEGSLAGNLTPDTKFPPHDFRRRYFQGRRLADTCRRLEALRPVLVQGRVKTMAEGALRYCLSRPACSSVLVGMRSLRHVEDNCRVADGRTLPPAQVRALQRHAWARDYYRGW